MADDPPQKMSWPQRIAWFLGILVSVTTIAGAFGFKYGQKSQASSIKLYINNIAGNLSSETLESAKPILKVINSAVDNATSGKDTPSDISKTSEQLAKAVTLLPLGIYSSGGQRIVSVLKDRTVLVCGDQHHIGYRGPNGYHRGESDFLVEGQDWSTTAGGQRKFTGGLVTLQEANPDHAVIDVQCEN